jgi:hypothetical protein
LVNLGSTVERFNIQMHVLTGIFGFIPDATMVGTVLINALSDILSHEIPQIERLMVDVPKEFSSDII